MRVMVSSNGPDKDSLIDPRFGRCGHFVIYDCRTGKLEVRPNLGQTASGGAGVVAAQQAIDEQVDVVITGSVGPNALPLLQRNDVAIYSCENVTVGTALELWKKGELELVDTAGPDHAGVDIAQGRRFPKGGR